MKYLLLSLFAFLSGCSSIESAEWMPPKKAQVYIQAGHEGRTTGFTGAVGIFGSEIELTPIVADQATRILEKAGVKVIRSDADRKRISEVDLALSLHFDSSGHCWSGASIGYEDDSHQSAAYHWKQLYSEYFPYKWMEDNFVENLSQYYNYKYTKTSDASLVLELGEIDCLEQAEWIQENLETIGQLVAYFAAQRVGNFKVAQPAMDKNRLKKAVASMTRSRQTANYEKDSLQ